MKQVQWDLSAIDKRQGLFQKIKWYEVGGMISLLVLMYSSYLFLYKELTLQAILVFNCFALLIHQFEEYGYPGWFPGMFNRWVFGSRYPLHYPLNRKSSWIVNVVLGWGIYGASVYWAKDVPELGLACIVLSGTNVLGHIAFSIKGRNWYNPGLITALFLFSPIIFLYYLFVNPMEQFGERTFWNGVLIGVIATAFVPIIILLFASERTGFEFGARHEVPRFRKFKSLKED